MNYTKKDNRDLLELADIIETKEHFSELDIYGRVLDMLPEDKRDYTQFNIQHLFFNCGMPACVSGWAMYKFPERFEEDSPGYFDPEDFGRAFNIPYEEAVYITDVESYKPHRNPRPSTVAKRIREVAKKIREINWKNEETAQ